MAGTRRVRATTRATVVAAALALLPMTAVPAVASAPAAPRASAPSHTAVGAVLHGRVAAAAHAPAVPGARRYTRRIPADVTQVVVVRAARWRSTTGTLTWWSRTSGGWRKVGSARARLGYGGLVVAAARVQSTGTTPAGLFTMTQTFGRQADPGTAMPYTRLTDDHWWVQDRRSPYYNQMRLGSQGGFARRTHGYNASEHLARMGAQYDYVSVIDFNRPRPVIGRGSGIFLHAYGDRTTVGCVSIPRSSMRSLLRWMAPGAHPRIVIGKARWLSGPPV
jgi:L,D-peptidoglycan transpeptidase YkuD (ErfK/YbiS/YcfS/YnhG family)